MAPVSGIPHAQRVDPHAVTERPAHGYTKADWVGLLLLALAGIGVFVFDLPAWLPLAVFAVWLPIRLWVQRPWARTADRTDGT